MFFLVPDVQGEAEMAKRQDWQGERVTRNNILHGSFKILRYLQRDDVLSRFTSTTAPVVVVVVVVPFGLNATALQTHGTIWQRNLYTKKRGGKKE